MHICHVSFTLTGGSGTVIGGWAKEQVTRGHRVSVVYSPTRDRLEDVRGAFPAETQFHPISVPRDISIKADLGAIKSLGEILDRLKPDILHLHNSKAGGVGRLAGRLRGLPMIYTPHGVSFLRRDVSMPARVAFYGIEWICGLLGAVVVANSRSELAAMRLLPCRKLTISNGVHLDDFDHIAAAERADRGPFRIVFCGRISSQKNPQLAVAIANAAPKEWEWLWIGDGEERQMVEGTSPIKTLGWVERQQALSLIASADVFLHPTAWEGMPMVLLEAMALKRAIVTSDVVGNRDVVRNGYNGFIASDVEGYVNALKALEQSADMRQRFGEAGRARVEVEFNQQKLATQWATLYDEVVKRC